MRAVLLGNLDTISFQAPFRLGETEFICVCLSMSIDRNTKFGLADCFVFKANRSFRNDDATVETFFDFGCRNENRVFGNSRYETFEFANLHEHASMRLLVARIEGEGDSGGLSKYFDSGISVQSVTVSKESAQIVIDNTLASRA